MSYDQQLLDRLVSDRRAQVSDTFQNIRARRRRRASPAPLAGAQPVPTTNRRARSQQSGSPRAGVAPAPRTDVRSA
jgi:hypothetical protein